MRQRGGNILFLQRKYIETGDGDILAELFLQLKALAFSVNRWYMSEDDICDIVDSICIRLLEKREPVIKTTPSAYLRTAIIFRMKRQNDERPEATALLEDPVCNEEEPPFDVEEYEAYVDKVIRQIETIPDIRTSVREHAVNCIENRRNFEEYRVSEISDYSDKRQFTQVMKEVRNGIEKTLQGK